MSIRILDEEERLDALNLIREVFFSMGNLGMNRQAAQSFLEFLSLEAQDLVYLGYYAGDLTGTIALSPEGDTVHLLLVRKERQRQGIGTALWQEACRRGSSEGIERFTVKALKGSEGFYRKNGFEAYGEESVSRGMKYLPMEYLAGREYLGRSVDVTIEVPYGAVHPHLNVEMRCAMGYADLSLSDGVFRNVYYCGSEQTPEQVRGIVAGILYRMHSSEPVWIVVPEGYEDRQAIIDAVGPMEQYDDTRVIWK
ncbi:MAG: GNAT family N-acetyltransferase [Solobacterium sp.]|nr:GNAT family N-acetyltransferase [Solobacterium sp.]MBR0478547.1 GNAT family N-acetyltransferase [Solobacterium sp.]